MLLCPTGGVVAASNIEEGSRAGKLFKKALLSPSPARLGALAGERRRAFEHFSEQGVDLIFEFPPGSFEFSPGGFEFSPGGFALLPTGLVFRTELIAFPVQAADPRERSFNFQKRPHKKASGTYRNPQLGDMIRNTLTDFKHLRDNILTLGTRIVFCVCIIAPCSERRNWTPCRVPANSPWPLPE